MGASKSKNLSFSDFESTANNNDETNKNTQTLNSQTHQKTTTQKKSKTLQSQQKSTTNHNKTSNITHSQNSEHQKESMEKIEERESENQDEEHESKEDKNSKNHSEEKEESQEEYTPKDEQISNLNSYIENQKKQKEKRKKLKLPSKNGEKFLEGDIVYKKIKRPETIKEETHDDEEQSQQSGSQMDEVEQLKKKKMLKEYDFYLTKEIPKNKFVNKNIQSNLPMDFADIEEKKDQVKTKTYLCFVDAKTKNKKRIEIKPNENQIIRDEVYLFNERRKKIKSIKPLTKEEYLKPYSYKVEFEMGKKGITNKVINKINENGKNEFIDVYPNGEGYKFKPNDSDEENQEEKKKVVENEENKEVLTNEQIEEIKKKDENDIVNIINKGLQENKLVEEEQKAENANDF